MTAFATADGRRLWQHDVRDIVGQYGLSTGNTRISWAAALGGGIVLLITGEENARLLRLGADGTPAWLTTLPHEWSQTGPWVRITTDGANTYVLLQPGYGRSVFHAVRDDGSTAASMEFPGRPGWIDFPAVSGGRVLLTVDREALFVRPADGRLVRAERNPSAYWGLPPVMGDGLVFDVGDTELTASELNTGKVAWTVPIPEVPCEGTCSEPTASGRSAILTDRHSILFVQNRRVEGPPVRWVAALHEFATDGEHIRTCPIQNGWWPALGDEVLILRADEQVAAFRLPGVGPATTGWTTLFGGPGMGFSGR